MKALLLGILLAGVALAGCTGDFNARQTEPFRVSIEGDEDPQEAVGGDVDIPDEDDGERQVIVIVRDDDDDGDDGDDDGSQWQQQQQTVNVQVVAQQTSPQPAVLIIYVQDRDTGQVLASRNVTVEGDIVQNVQIDVRGRDNVVLVTQVAEGEADVDVTTDGSQSVEAEDNATATATGDTTTADDNGTATG